MIFIYVCDMVSQRRKEHLKQKRFTVKCVKGNYNLSALLLWISTLLESGSRNCELPKR